MADFIYCISSPSIPGIIRIEQSPRDPREQFAHAGPRGRSERIDWVVRVIDGAASLAELNHALAEHRDENWPGHFRCGPTRARAFAIRFTTARPAEAEATVSAPSLPSLVLGLGLAVQFLGMANGDAGPSAALTAAALFWVFHTLQSGSREQRGLFWR